LQSSTECSKIGELIRVRPGKKGLFLNCFLIGLVATILGMATLPVRAELPKITGKPVIDAPTLLDWPADQGTLIPNRNDPTANILNDVHAQLTYCDLVLSTEGNLHPALKDIWPKYLNPSKEGQLQGDPLTMSQKRSKAS
jgi:hypothetical protein